MTGIGSVMKLRFRFRHMSNGHFRSSNTILGISLRAMITISSLFAMVSTRNCSACRRPARFERQMGSSPATKMVIRDSVIKFACDHLLFTSRADAEFVDCYMSSRLACDFGNRVGHAIHALLARHHEFESSPPSREYWPRNTTRLRLSRRPLRALIFEATMPHRQTLIHRSGRRRAAQWSPPAEPAR